MAKTGLQEPEPPFPDNRLEPPGKESDLEPAPRYEAPLYQPAGKLRGKVAIVTGGDSGIGRAVVTLFAREGADVAVLCLPEEQEDAETTLATVSEAGQVGMVLAGDVGATRGCWIIRPPRAPSMPSPRPWRRCSLVGASGSIASPLGRSGRP